MQREGNSQTYSRLGWRVKASWKHRSESRVRAGPSNSATRAQRLVNEDKSAENFLRILASDHLTASFDQAATGVRVALNGFFNDLEHTGRYVGLQKADDKLPAYWPRSRRTDADGRFTFEGVPRGTYANLSFWQPDYAVDEVTVNTTEGGVISPSLKGFEIVPVKPDFNHTLEPARPVQGRVTDKATGKPLSGMLVEMIPMRRHGGMTFSARTDSDGRYRISGHQTGGMYITTAYPPADSGYLGASDQHHGWPAGARFPEVNFSLEQGRLVSGRVIDQSSKQPISGAAVVYEAARKIPTTPETLIFETRFSPIGTEGSRSRRSPDREPWPWRRPTRATYARP